MPQLAVTEVKENGATIPTEVLHVLGVSTGDQVAFIENNDGSISLMKASRPATPKRPISDFVGIFATGEQRSLDEELALLREMRYGDELENGH
jgi:bifunctional DNA-binding transcriptional regulator/antitoxin component of YhaV-PrlF toxin-antitoxin module